MTKAGSDTVTLLGTEYEIVDVIDHITIADSFVLRNKIGRGHGEAKLYIGPRQREDEYRLFFENFRDVQGLFIKKDLEGYLEEAAFEYEEQEQVYSDDISEYFQDNKRKVAELNGMEFFEIRESPAGGDSRFYLEDTGSSVYKVFRTISLPIITYISILKLFDISKKHFVFYFRPFLDYFYDKRNAQERIQETAIKKETISVENKQILKARLGQGRYRESIIEEFSSCCLITGITDERLLIASHIKPWVDSSDAEKVSRYNGLLLSPTYDKLFDQGFITFSMMALYLPHRTYLH